MGGTTHINSLIGQMLTWAVVLAVAAFIAYGATWAVGSLSANPQNAGRGKTGMIICLAAALLLGGGLRLVEWTYDTEAHNFQADSTGYTVDDSPQGPDISGVSNGESRLWTILFRWTIRIVLAVAMAYVALVVGLVLLVIVVFMLVLFVGRRAVRHSGW